MSVNFYEQRLREIRKLGTGYCIYSTITAARAELLSAKTLELHSYKLSLGGAGLT